MYEGVFSSMTVGQPVQVNVAGRLVTVKVTKIISVRPYAANSWIVFEGELV